MIKLQRHNSKLFLLIILFFSGVNSFSQSTGDEIIGTWWNQEKDGQIEIYKSGSTYSGKLIWMKNQNDPVTGKLLLDKKNPNEKLRGKPLLNSNLMYGFIFIREDKEWSDGKIYDGRKGKTYKCIIKLNADSTIKVTGYIGASWMGLGETSIWTRKNN
ncbi:DUF2147 domain-containing protein [Flavobacterium saccharophilum]|uniref:DUF2147 domain-containing protein n=1 Tax=Flavobacterium saccharophilum TaxID=29534 RepID=A0A1M7D2H0_9FLAO|nr:DUF2147 domain-containing protein [Flavobacterium saccharophilum]SHL73618.1 hypothetical protein SAMN05444366_1377 [Flavobacterium saccharophilum]